ncbi:MAG: HD domain-containing protein [candidate division NC10 bacterium]|nr:HD domain-containing protein [candidate division NC10 bacterium]
MALDVSAALRALSADPLLSTLVAAATRRGMAPLYLVGGYLRDHLLGRGVRERDLDLVCPGDRRALVAECLAALGGTLVPLDSTTVRIAFTRGTHAWQVDVAALRGEGIEADLLQRDFTVNALALDLTGDRAGKLIDVTGGVADLEARRIRVPSSAVLREDPLRCLRAVRMASQLGFRVEPATAAAIRSAASGLAAVSAERIRDELFKILDAARPTPHLAELDELGVLPVILPPLAALKGVPQGPPHRQDIWEHTLEVAAGIPWVLERLPRLVPEAGVETVERMATPAEGTITRRSLLVFAALLHDVGKPAARTEEGGRIRFLGHETRGAAVAAGLCEALRLGRQATVLVTGVVAHHLRPILLAAEPSITLRARFRLLRDLGEVAEEVLLHSLADVRATAGEEAAFQRQVAFVRETFAFRQDRVRPAEAAPLLRGEEVMAALGIAPGPLVGDCLAAVAEWQAAGEIRSPAEAVERLRAAWPVLRQSREAS